jgi:endonuclease/exonuclease/phosphatase family metal-dependent hydrolase
VPFRRLQAIEHDLAPCYPALRAVPNRRALERSDLWRRIRVEVERVTSAVERGDAETQPGPSRALTGGLAARRLRVVAWNVQRGARFEAILGALRDDPVLACADLVLLEEIDCGLGRSANRNVARELAEALGMSYVFGPSYLTLADDWGENRGALDNTTALAGTAILTRAPVRRAENVDLPALRDKFSSSERRLGKKRALLIEAEVPGGPLLVGACHLDSNASPAQRARQLAALLDRMPGAGPAIVGGDFNCSTHDLSSPLALLGDALGKLVRRGVRRTVDGYMRPEVGAEGPLFELLRAHGFGLDGFNDRGRATYRYDFNDPYALEKLRRTGGPPLVALVRWLVRRWDHCLPARLDWLAARGLRPASATVVEPRDAAGRLVSDHAAVVCDAEL